MNIINILKCELPQTPLYDVVIGAPVYLRDCSNDKIFCSYSNKEIEYNNEGKLYSNNDAIQALTPSKEMRDWSKFSWKKGDVLMAGVDNFCIFDKWNNDEYTEFDAAFVTPDYRSDVLKTKYWHKVISETIIKRYISNIERNYGGKLNLTTLEIEKAQPGFKEGDVLFVRCKKYSYIEIFNYSKRNGDLYDYASLDTTTQELDISGKYKIYKDAVTEIRFATEKEKQQFLDALAKEGKAWDAEKKQIVDLKPKVELKPFDKVLVREEEYSEWQADFFSNIDEDNRFVCIGSTWSFCIPYNEETAKLIGTKNNVEG